MKLSQTIEWATHICGVLAALPEGYCMNAKSLAAFYELPPAYVAKTMQALSKSNLVQSAKGTIGGYRLAIAPDKISLWSIREAIIGVGPVFKCTEIRRRGPCGVKGNPVNPCGIALAYKQADAAYRNILESTKLSQIIINALEENSEETNASNLKQIINLAQRY